MMKAFKITLVVFMCAFVLAIPSIAEARGPRFSFSLNLGRPAPIFMPGPVVVERPPVVYYPAPVYQYPPFYQQRVIIQEGYYYPHPAYPYYPHGGY